MKLYIKYMVSNRCKLLVKQELKKLGYHKILVRLGEVEILDGFPPEKQQKLKTSLLKSGLEIIEDKRSILIEKIKRVIIEMVHYSDKSPRKNFSEYLSEKLKYDYTYLANLFSEIEGTTIEHYIIVHKIERVKELLEYNEYTLTEIASLLHYSSVAHLSNQFKKITGQTPSKFKAHHLRKRNSLENV